VVGEAGTPNDFIGHPFNDTFLILTGATEATALADRLKARFDDEVRTHYSFMDREQGYVLIRDKDGHLIQASLMTLNVTARPV
ncbi:MAG: response regulator, partial [Anaerolineales bacterium]